MSTKPGRIRRNGSGDTLPTRMRTDLLEMAGWVSRVEGRSLTVVIDEAARPALARKVAALGPAIEAIKAAVGKKAK